MKSIESAEFWADDAAAIAERDQVRIPSEPTHVRHNAKPFTDLEDAAKSRQFWLKFAAAGAGICLMVAWIVAPRSTAGRIEHEPQLATQQERKDIRQLVQKAISIGAILRIESDNEFARLYVLEEFKKANIEQKTFITWIAYLDAFALSKNATHDHRGMVVIDGITGERLKNVNMSTLGLQW